MKERIIEKYLYINGDKFKYTINFGNRKRTCLHIRNGELEVRAPYRTSEVLVEKIVQEKYDWIVRSLQKYPKVEVVRKQYINGDKFWVLGNEYTLKIENQSDLKEKEKVVLDEYSRSIVVKLYINKNSSINTSKRVEQVLNRYYDNLADSELSFSMEKMMRKTDMIPESFKIRNFKRAWGNCSSKKVISLNKELVKYSRNAIDYVCLHELCHLKYMNHSKDFWHLVGFYMPDYKMVEMELKAIRT